MHVHTPTALFVTPVFPSQLPSLCQARSRFSQCLLTEFRDKRLRSLIIKGTLLSQVVTDQLNPAHNHLYDVRKRKESKITPDPHLKCCVLARDAVLLE